MPSGPHGKRRRGDRTIDGLVDNCDQAVFAVDQFLDDARKGHLGRRDRAQETLSGLDPVQRVNPPDTEEGRIEALLEFREEFNEALHGDAPYRRRGISIPGRTLRDLPSRLVRSRGPSRTSARSTSCSRKGRRRELGGAAQETVRLIRASAANLDYFFSHLDASWLPFLLDEGFFQNPTPPETGTTKEGQTWIRFPNWPESQYLARIAAEAPERVVEAIELIPETANPVSTRTSSPPRPPYRANSPLGSLDASNGGSRITRDISCPAPDPPATCSPTSRRRARCAAAFRLAGTLLKISRRPGG